jgi:hypothetical protein
MLKHLYPIFIFALLLSACIKPDIDPQWPETNCRITTYVGTGEYLFNGISYDTIFYNAIGNPTFRKRSDVGTGSTNIAFKYDSRHRLTDRITFYQSAEVGEVFEQWHMYTYDALGRIYSDTTYYFGYIADFPIPINSQLFYDVSTFQYDKQNRVIKKVQTGMEGQVTHTLDYTYNGDQNLSTITHTYGYNGSVVVTEFVYDKNTKNINRTHRLFQFLNLDYSVNNRATVDSANRQRLPLKVSASHGTQLSFLDVTYFDTLTFDYDCR